MILQGHVLDVIDQIEDGSVSMVMTSPPYWGLRNYGDHRVLWGGDNSCKHEWVEYVVKGISGGTKSPKVKVKGEENFQITKDGMVGECIKCGAMCCELGREPLPEIYIDHLCDIFDAIKPKLADWGSLYVNLGDTHYGGGQGEGSNLNRKTAMSVYNPTARNKIFPAKSLSMVPFSFAKEMEQRGWILRNVIPWHKPNPMPFSGKDRWTVDFEYVFFFVKKKNYYFFQQLEKAHEQNFRVQPKYGGNKAEGYGNPTYSGKKYEATVMNGTVVRNARTVWYLPTANSRENHFAVYPEELCRAPISASCPDEVCTKCGQPVYKEWKREEVEYEPGKYYWNITGVKHTYCECNAPFKTGVVLDPFFGRGTTGKEAMNQGKDWIGIELSKEYVKIAKKYLSIVEEDDDELGIYDI